MIEKNTHTHTFYDLISQCISQSKTEHEMQLFLEKEMIRTPKLVSNAFGLVPASLRRSFEWTKLVSLIEDTINTIDDHNVQRAFAGLTCHENLVALLSNSLSSVIHNKLIPQIPNNQTLKIKVVHIIEAIRSNLYGYTLAKISSKNELTQSDLDAIQQIAQIRTHCVTLASVIFEFFLIHSEELRLFSYSSSLTSDDQKESPTYKHSGWFVWMGGYELLLSVPLI